MVVSSAWIAAGVIFGVCFLVHTIYFLYKLIKARNTDYSGNEPSSTIHMTDGEATCCMGWAWTSCINKTTNRITLKTFIVWYVVALCVDVVLGGVMFYCFHLLDRTRR